MAERIVIYRGEHVTLPFVHETEGEDITGWTLVFTVARAPNVTPKLIGPLECDVTDGPGRLYEVTLTTTHTDLEPGNYKYDVWRMDAGYVQLKAIEEFHVLGAPRTPVEG